MLDMLKKGFWSILPFSAVKHYPHLKLSPAGVIPQRTRRPRPIIDYSFTEVNRHSLPLSPWPAMQIGQALPRILQQIAYADPSYGPPLLLKLDLADGYYRVRLTPEAALELAVVIPGPTSHQNWVGIPLSLPMGWTHSPPYFCAFTESACDVANHVINTPNHPWHEIPHPLETISQDPHLPQETEFSPHIVHPPTTPPRDSQPLGLTDVYIDDFIGVAQSPQAPAVLRALLHAISNVFRYHSHPDDKPLRKQTISTSKLAKGDGCWSTTKTILGWEIDTAKGHLRLPQHKAERLRDLLEGFLQIRRTSRKRWLSLLGELRHMSTAIKGASYLFSILQSVLVQKPTATRLRLTPLVQSALRDWQALAWDLATHPVPISTLVPRAPHYLGAVDASQRGIGGFWVATKYSPPHQPLLFRYEFPPHIQQKLVSAANPTGSLTNSDFELAAIVLGTATLAENTSMQHDSIWCGSDNTPAVSWCKRGSPTSTNANAHLVRWLAQLTRRHCLTLQPVSVPGKSNELADFCSRSFSLSDQEFDHAIQSNFPIEPCWKIVHPSSENVSAMISALSSTMSPWESPPKETPHPIPSGISGRPSATVLTPTPPCPPPPTRSYSCNSSPIVTVGANFLPAKLLSVAKQWEMPFEPLARRWPTWDTPTHASSRQGN